MQEQQKWHRLTLTAVVEAVQLEQVAVAELHPLAYDIAKSRDLGDNGGLRAVAKGSFTVMHHRSVVVGHAQRAGGGVIVGVEVMLFTCRSNVVCNKFIFIISSHLLLSTCEVEGWEKIT